MGTGRKGSIVAISWFSRKDLRPILHPFLLTTCIAFWMLTLKEPLELVQSGDWLTPVDLKDTFSTLMFQWLPDRAEMGTSILHESGSLKNTQTHQGFVVCLLVALFEVNQVQLMWPCPTHLLQNGTRVRM